MTNRELVAAPPGSLCPADRERQRTLRAEIHLHYRATEPGVLRLISSIGLPNHVRREVATLRSGDGLHGLVARTGEPLTMTTVPSPTFL